MNFDFSDKNIIFVAKISLSKQNLKTMNIKRNQTDGCDKMSRIYENMFNVLQNVMRDEDKLKKLSSLDYSALGLYIGKFVEQEINSSVVQIMRAFRGVKMPDYYCRLYDKRDKRIHPVETNRHAIYLNSKKSLDEPTSLRTIPLGDAYCALEALKTEDRNFFDKYPWLNDQDFLDAWQELAKYRNKMAHIGEIIDADILKRNYELFLQFLKFMPDITKAKIELAPEGYMEELPQPKKKEEKPQIIVSTDDNDEYTNAAESLWEDDSVLMDGIPGMGRMLPNFNCYYKNNNYRKKNNSKVTIFEDYNGKKGLKVSRKTIVPANYEGFGFLPKSLETRYKSIIAVREGKYVLAALDGSGKELTEEAYDEIRLANKVVENSPYMFRQHGLRSWGIMNQEGEIICKNMIDAYICDENSMLYESGELRGYWKYSKGYPFLSPIFDDIEMPENPRDPILFVLNGFEGHVKLFEDEYEFISKAEINKLDEEDRHKTLECCISEE